MLRTGVSPSCRRLPRPDCTADRNETRNLSKVAITPTPEQSCAGDFGLDSANDFLIIWATATACLWAERRTDLR